MKDLIIVEHNNQRIMFTFQLAEFYKTDDDTISQNFRRNPRNFILGEDYYVLQGAELKQFKAELKRTNPQIEGSFRRANILYLWTEYGALMHAKSLQNDRALEVFRELRKSYFVVQQQQKQEQTRRFPWTEEAEQLRQLNMKQIQPGYFSISAFVLQKLIYVDLSGMIPSERARIDISFGQYFARWLQADKSGQLKNCNISPEHAYNKLKILEVGHIVDSKRKNVYDVKHYANLYAGDCSNFWELWYAPVILPAYFNGSLPDGLPRMNISKDVS